MYFTLCIIQQMPLNQGLVHYLHGKNLGYSCQEKQIKVVKKKEIRTLKKLTWGHPQMSHDHC